MAWPTTKIIVQEEKITIDEEEYFDNLNQLVEVGGMKQFILRSYQYQHNTNTNSILS